MQKSLKIRPDIVRATAIGALRAATSATHERLHEHPCFASLMRGEIDRAEYSALLLALYGFHKVYVNVSTDALHRCARLNDDLMFISSNYDPNHQAPCLPVSKSFSSAERWGVEYVLAGAAMGGKLLARKLDNLLGECTQKGRSFFVGDGSARGRRWCEFVQALEEALPTAADRSVAGRAALQTFEHFENCMNRVVAERTRGVT